MRIFKPTYRDRQGRRREASRYYAEVTLHDRRVARIAGFVSQRATEELGRRIEEIVALKSVSAPMTASLRQWVDGLPADIRDRLAEVGILDAATTAMSKPLAVHLDDYAAHLRAKEDTASHVNKVVAHIGRVAAFCGWRSLDDVGPEGFEAWRTAERDRGLSARTVNAVRGSCKRFMAWAVRHGRATRNPLDVVGRLNEAADRRLVRRALTHDEARRLLAATEREPRRFGMEGKDRAALYRVALETGLRWSELRALEVQNVKLDGKRPEIELVAKYTKAKRADRVPIRDELAAFLKDYLTGKLPTAKAFPMPASDHGADMLRADLAAAGVEVEDAAGRVLDFHALRHTTGSWLAEAGVHPKLIQTILRHSTITLTMDRYAHVTAASQAAAVEALPDFSPERGAARATGTDDIPGGGISVLASCLPESGRKAGCGGQKLTTSGRVEAKSGNGLEGQEMPISGHSVKEKAGGPRWIRTTNPGIMSPLLCH